MIPFTARLPDVAFYLRCTVEESQKRHYVIHVAGMMWQGKRDETTAIVPGDRWIVARVEYAYKIPELIKMYEWLETSALERAVFCKSEDAEVSVRPTYIHLR